MYENEFQVRARDLSYRHFHVQAVPIIAPNGAVREWIGAAVDITEEKETALTVQRQRDELAHVARITTMGELAASLAHELNQPLTAILSNAQAAQRFSLPTRRMSESSGPSFRTSWKTIVARVKSSAGCANWSEKAISNLRSWILKRLCATS